VSSVTAYIIVTFRVGLGLVLGYGAT